MGDLGSGLAWLCGTCCGLRNSDLTADGSRFSSSSKEHPAEREIDKEFMARNYRKDAAGRLHSQPTPTNSMLPRLDSDDSKKSKGSAKPQREQPEDDVMQMAVSVPQEDDNDAPVITIDHASSRRPSHDERHSPSLKSAG